MYFIAQNLNSGEEVGGGKLNQYGIGYAVLPNHITQVIVEYHSDPNKQIILEPTEPTVQAAPDGWFERIGGVMEMAWENQKRSMRMKFELVTLATTWGWETLQGDFNENPSTGQIVTNAVVTMIPVVDQVADVRDIVANLKLLVWDKRYNEFFPWLALFFTLIGLIPVLGSALKGVLKTIWKGAKLDEVLRVINWFMKDNGVKWLKTLKDGKLAEYADEAAKIGHDVFDAVIEKLDGLKRYLPDGMRDAHTELDGTLATLRLVKGEINGWFANIANKMSERIGKTLDEGKPEVHNAPVQDTHTKTQEKQAPPDDDIIDDGAGMEGVGSVPDTPALNPKTRLPRTNGQWEGDPGNGFWRSNIDEVNEITGGKPIEFVNGRPVFTPWAKGQVKFKPGQLDGSKADFDAVYKYVAEQKNLSSPNAAKNYLKEVGLTPHHLDNVTIQFIPTKLHGNIPHIGSASDLRGGF